ncbi:MAG: SDR family NAD(P)-dependent oxidoreductase [Cyclobacteriaceae bacterium]|nr:SDR family NAD(P)-dependent oxidoreductase [Cyclobacteriaceae bacterium]
MTDKNWTTANIPDLTGKILIVTGGNSGLGYESVKAFADHGGEVVLACRSMEKGEDAKKNMGILKGRVVVMALDLMDLSSIQKFAIDFKSKYKRLDVLLNNAGIMTTPFGLTR